ncbi:MAG: adenylate kinase [Traorella sp.]
MNKVMVIGCPGSGKSTFSRKLHELTNLPLYHLDMLYWNEDKTTVTREVFCERLQHVLEKESWIIDGNYLFTMEKRLQVCDTVFYLDYPVEVCLDGIYKRRGKKREDMPWIEEEVDEEFLQFIKDFEVERKPAIMKLLHQYQDKEIYIFKNRDEADEYLSQNR